MTVSLLHPEDLLEKAAHGKLTEAERVRLEAHLADCSTCRFEHLVRADFAEELDNEAELSTQRLLAIIEGIPAPPSLAPPANDPRPEPISQEHPSSHPGRKRARRTATFAMLVAAALFVGSVATAAGAWERISATFAGPSEIEEKLPTPRSSLDTPPTRPSPPGAPSDTSETSEPRADLAADTASDVAPGPAPGPAVVLTAGFTPGRSSGVALNPNPNRTVGLATHGGDAAALFEQASEARNRADYARAIALHRQLQTTYPASREAHASYATVGRLLLDRGDAVGALADFDAYRRRGAGPLDEVVLVGRATALERLGRTGDARDAWQTLLDEFPSTPYAGHARTRLEPLDLGSRGDRARPR